MKCSDLFENAPDVEIKTLFYDSRVKVNQGMFFCVDGLVHDGHEFMDDAIENGAVCIVHKHDVENRHKGIVYIKVENVTETMARVAARFYKYPSKKLKVFGVTGTNGKSTITKVMKDIVSRFESCGYIGTISISYGDVELAADLTTPDAIRLQSVMADMVKAKVKAVALEVSSHGLEQNRVNGIEFDAAVFTNLTYDHLDYHGTFENYLNAKKKFFKMVHENCPCVINIDDEYANEFIEASAGRVVTYGVQNEADYRADNIQLGFNDTKFTLIYQNHSYQVQTNLITLYNVYNLLAVIAALHECGYALEDILVHLNTLQQVEGRCEIVSEGQPFNVIIDFAHTPDGFQKIFEYAKQITPEDRNIISVFGSAGKRDKKKRKVMGSIADEFCGNIILTDDDPRTEDPSEIANEIKSGIVNANTIYIPDRSDAIRQAIEMANVNDTVLILGKGIEEWLAMPTGKEYYMGDKKSAINAIRKYYLGIEETENEEK